VINLRKIGYTIILTLQNYNIVGNLSIVLATKIKIFFQQAMLFFVFSIGETFHSSGVSTQADGLVKVYYLFFLDL